MSKGTLNRAMLIGRIGREPQVRYTPNGSAVAQFSLATNEAYKDKNGQLKVQTDWHRVVAWSKLAEICGQYLHKGSLVCIEGLLKTRVFQDRDGSKKFMTEIIASNMQMLGSKDHPEKTESAEHQTEEAA
jgi:single-strand DNA-binding protein